MNPVDVLAAATRAYFDELDPGAAREEQDVATFPGSASNGIDFDYEA